MLMIMRNRTIQILLLLLTLSISSCGKHYQEHPYYKLSAKQTGYNKHNGEHVISISLELNSKLDSLPPFYLMTCSWYNHAISNIKEIRLGHYLCDANFMDIVNIQQDQYLELKTVAGSKGDFPNDNFRVGLIIVDTTDLSYRRYWENMDSWERGFNQLQNDKNRIVWSNVIELEISDDTLKHAWPYWEVKDK